MPTQTTNYNLIKPTENETADILIINSNMDIIDAAIAGAQTKADVAEINAKAYADGLTATKADSAIVNAHLAETLYYTTQKLGIDANSIYTEVQHKRTDDTLILKSVLSGGISPQYTTRTETKYASDGTTVEWTKTYTLTYDSNDNVSSEVLI